MDKPAGSQCKWCPNPSIAVPGSTRMCESCRIRVDRVIRAALERQADKGSSDVAMAREFGVVCDTWRRIRHKVAGDPYTRVASNSIDPFHPSVVADGEVDPPDSARDPTPDPMSGAWEHRAACRKHDDPDIFFPVHKRGDVVDKALKVCAGCTVTDRCRDNRGKEGVWGGRLYVVR